MMLVTQTIAPMVNSSPGLANVALRRMPSTSRTAAAAAPTVMTATIAPVVMRSQRLFRSMRPGSPTMSTPRSTRRKTG